MPSMTITTTNEHAAELAAAIGWHLGLNGAASAAQVKAYTIALLKEKHRAWKEHVNHLAVPPVVPIEPT